MKRRDIIKLVPLSIFGFAASSIKFQSSKSQSSSKDSNSSTAYAQVKQYNGTPTLFLDGQPTYYSGMWVSAPSPDHWGHVEWSAEHPTSGNANTAQRTAETGIHIYVFDVGREWCGPQEGHSGHFNFSDVEASFGRILKTDPQARLHLRIQLEQGGFRGGKEGWWNKVYPEECEITTEGKRPEQSYASQVWRKEAKDFLKSYIEHIKSIGMAEYIIAYQVMAAQSGEWTKWSSAGTEHCGDYSEPMRRHFRAFLREKYNGDVSALKKAWNSPVITFDTAEVPSQNEQLQTKHYTFRDPSSEQKVIDYFTCLANLCSGLIIDFCQTIKEGTNNKAMAGVFYGYTLFGAYNQGFFGERSKGSGFYGETGEGNSTAYSKIQRSGHLAVHRVLDSPFVDFVVSPICYGFRGIGGDGFGAYLTESVRLHGKLCIAEDDVRLHDTPPSRLQSPPRYGRTKNLKESIAVLRRNFGRALIHGQGIWRAPIADSSLYPTLKRFNDLGTFALHLDRIPSAEIALFVDEESIMYETLKYNLNLANIPNQILQGVSRLGAPTDFYLLDDFIEGKLSPYKLYIFLNSFRLDTTRREKLLRELRQDGRVALWIYAPGYIKGNPSLKNMTELTGFKFAMGELPWSTFMHIVDFDHPITAGLPQDLFWNFNSSLGPLFCLDDSDARTLCNIVFSQGCCAPGMGVKVFPEWTSIYCGMPNLPAPILRGIARFSRVHIYSEAGDVLHASRQLLCVHTVSGGNRTFHLPQVVDEVYDLFNNKSIARNTGKFQVILSPASSEFYYTGDARTLSKMKIS
jgi:hypothetical protein